jgi:2-oxoglutarate ferredoxin oxidoreductase subunit gamma
MKDSTEMLGGNPEIHRMRTEIRISGFGGQGVGLAGHILGKAFAIYEGKEAVMTQSYGPEARGGASNADIVVSDQAIDYPFVQHPDILLTLSQEAYNTSRPAAQSSALVIIDKGLVTPFKEDHPLGIIATELAESLGNRIVTNIVMLGFFTAASGLVRRDAMEQAIQTSVRERFVQLNLKAYDTGYQTWKAP